MIKELNIEEGFSLVKIENDSSENTKYEKDVSSTFIQLHFLYKE